VLSAPSKKSFSRQGADLGVQRRQGVGKASDATWTAGADRHRPWQEFTSKALDQWLTGTSHAAFHHAWPPDEAMENGHIESFHGSNGKFREECQNEH
jgi:hypothetical protein